MTKKNFAALFTAAAAAAVMASTAFAAGPSGFNAPAGAPQGFEPTATTVADVLKNSHDDQVVVLKGKFTKLIKHDKYEFVDEAGNAITAELDDDRDWSNIAKDQPIEIEAEVDRYKEWIKLEVKRADPL